MTKLCENGTSTKKKISKDKLALNKTSATNTSSSQITNTIKKIKFKKDLKNSLNRAIACYTAHLRDLDSLRSLLSNDSSTPLHQKQQQLYNELVLKITNEINICNDYYNSL